MTSRSGRRRAGRWALALALHACGGREEGARDAVPIAAQGSSGGAAEASRETEAERESQVLALAAGHPRFAGQTLILLASARSGTREAWVVWPAFGADGARPVSDDTVGLTVDLSPEGALVLADAGWNPRDRAGRALRSVLGADRFERAPTVRGVRLADLPAQIEATFAAFARACGVGDRAGASRSARAMASLFAWELVAYEDVVTEMLWAAASGEYTLVHGATTPLDGGARARITAVITYRGRPHPIAVLAAPLPDAPDRWVITQEESPP